MPNYKTGYRMLDYDDKTDTYKTLFHGIRGSRVVEPGHWIHAEHKRVSDGTSNHRYLSGFHILPTLEECIKYARKFKHLGHRVIMLVHYRGKRLKHHSLSPVILADSMLLPMNAFKYRCIYIRKDNYPYAPINS
jgi:hypothetical protein